MAGCVGPSTWSIISYLAARPSRDLITAAYQQVTHAWWRERRFEFDLYVSQVVVDEATAGDPDAALRRAGFLQGLPLLDIGLEAADLAAALCERVPLPPRAAADAAHIAVAAFHGIDFLLTWNSAHIANAELRPWIEKVCRHRGFRRLSFAHRTNSWGKAMTEAQSEKERWRDPIVAEVRQAREALFAAAGYDIREFCRRMRERQATSGHRVVTRDTPGKPGEAA